MTGRWMYWANGAAGETIPWPTTTSGSPAVWGTGSEPPTSSTSQRVAVHGRGSRPDVTRTKRPSPSTARMSTRRPRTFASR